jgi:hypothetical protein
MNQKFKEFFNNPVIIFLVAWGVLNLLQARFTPLDNDEAYYWMYSKYLSWGYFDHPPMIALMIKTGYLFFHNELGVRLIVVLSQLLAIYIIWMLTDKELRVKRENILLFCMLIVILPVCHVYSFIATPDAPLIFFTALFLLVYKRFLDDDSWKNILFLGFSMAALMYSKYHGGLLILFVILSNPGLLKKISFYSAALFAVLLFVPHLIWQYTNGFPSVKYHLVDRVSSFNPENVPNYLVSQFSFHNPFILVILIWIMIKVKSHNSFDKALKYIIAGFFIFFFISSFRYWVEPQWTALVCVPMIIILFNNSEFKPWFRNYIKWLSFILFPLILFGRFASVIDFVPVSFLKSEFHNKKQWSKDISTLAGDRPVIFTNSYQRPSVYTFYTGKFAYSVNNLNYRKTQFELWDFEEKVHGKEVLYVPSYFSDIYKANLTKEVLTKGDTIYVKTFNDFQSLQKEFVILNDKEYTFSRSMINSLNLKIFNPYPYTINLKHKELPVAFRIAFIKNGNIEVTRDIDLPENISQLNTRDTISVDCKFSLEDLPSGVYSMAIVTQSGILYDNYSSEFRKVKINE